MEVNKLKTDFIVCPQCRNLMDLHVDEYYNGDVMEGVLSCGQCSGSYSITNFIPFLVIDEKKARQMEGIAVDLENAIKAYKRITGGDSLVSGLAFDRDLKNQSLVFLDVGCGLGKNLVVLKKNGIMKAFGFDLVPELLQIARETYGLDNVFIANAHQIPIADESIDRCLLYDTIEHCSDPVSVLQEIHRVLKTDGILYMNVPNARSFGDRIFRWGGILLYGKTSHIQKFTMKSVIKLLHGNGFSIESTITGRGIFIDYPQLDRFKLLKKTLASFFSNEVSGWEFTLKKR